MASPTVVAFKSIAPQPPSEHRIVALYLRDLVAAAPQPHIGHTVLEAARVRPSQLLRSSGRLHFEHLYRALDHAHRTRDIPVPGLQIGLRRKAADYGVYGEAVLASPRLGDSLRMAERIYPSAWRYVRLDVMQQAGSVVNRWAVQPAVRCHPVPVLQAVTALSVATVRELMPDADWSAMEIRYGFAPPRDAALYRRLLPCRVQFGAAATELRFPLGWLERHLDPPGRTATPPNVHSLALKAWQQQFTTGSWADRVRWCLHHHADDGFPDLPRVAALCGVAPRTLRLHLQREGLHFQRLLAEVRMGLAHHYLHHSTMSIEDLAQLLGYAHPPSFSRAVRDHFGSPPQALRNAAPTPR